MKNKKLLTIAVLIMSGTLLTSTVMAKGGCPNCGGGENEMRGGGMPQMISQLDLTDEQVKSLKKNKKAKHRKMIKVRAALAEARLDLGEALEAESPNRSKVDKIVNNMGELHKEKIANHAEAVIFLKSILTPEQKQKMEKLSLMHGGNGGYGMGHGKGKKGHRGHKKGRGM